MRKLTQSVVLLGLGLVLLNGCSNLSAREQSTLTGGAIGAAGGAVIGNQFGNPVTGALIGGAAGAATGFFINRHNGSEE